jgi:hypothetical protein
MSLRFNHYSKMNDPRESKYWSSSLNKEDYQRYIIDAPMKEKVKILRCTALLMMID